MRIIRQSSPAYHFSPLDFGVSCDVPFEHPVANKVSRNQ